MAMSDDTAVGKPQAPVAALLAGVPGLEETVKAVIAAWQEFDTQTDALLVALGLPDTDYDYSMPSYMSQLLSAFEVKSGRALSTANRNRLGKVADGLSGHAEEIK